MGWRRSGNWGVRPIMKGVLMFCIMRKVLTFFFLVCGCSMPSFGHPVVSIRSQFEDIQLITCITESQWDVMVRWNPSGSTPLPLSLAEAIVLSRRSIVKIPKINVEEWEVREVAIRGHRFYIHEDMKWFYVVTWQHKLEFGSSEISVIVLFDSKVMDIAPVED